MFSFSHALYIYDDEDYVDIDELNQILESYDRMEDEANYDEPFFGFDGWD